MENSLIIYQTEDGQTKIDVHIDNDTVWLSLDQMSELFQRDKSTISRHIKNIFSEGELDKNSVVANFATTAADGKTYNVDYYNLDVIISVGLYKVNERANALLPMMGMKTVKGSKPTLAEQKAKQEYQKYKKLHSGELSPVEQAFLQSIEKERKRLKK